MRPSREYGFSIVEMLIAMAIGTAVVLVYLQLVLDQKRQQVALSSADQFKEALLNNLIEARAKDFDSLPPIGTCWSRLYDASQKLVSSSTNAPCAPVAPPMGSVVIVWEVLGPEDIQVTFNSPGMKLPTTGKLVRKVRLHALATLAGSIPEYRESFTIFRRAP
ncbi:MAG: prepilin-type N-terminal cleavage/methylation domain-containing protein [Bdellovibrionaceae bacterium]|nr:prepilin-type N-terminal cleavage/methylation domain-containing protein [Pseudobdellovibrionaceae bacterium]